MTTDSLREVLENPRANPVRRVAAMEILAERRKLKDEYTKYLDFYRIQHGDVGKILKARPDWAPHFEKEIRQQVEKTRSREFALSVQPEALKNLEVLLSMDERKVAYLEKYGKEPQLEAIREVLEENFAVEAEEEESELRRMLRRLEEESERAPTPEERAKALERYTRARAVIERISRSPVFNVRRRPRGERPSYVA